MEMNLQLDNPRMAVGHFFASAVWNAMEPSLGSSETEQQPQRRSFSLLLPSVLVHVAEDFFHGRLADGVVEVEAFQAGGGHAAQQRQRQQ